MEEEADLNTELQIRAGRASLKMLMKDMFQILQVGNRAEKEEADMSEYFLAMIPSCDRIIADYTGKFEELSFMAIMANVEHMFPTDDDVSLRNTCQTYYYTILKISRKFGVKAKESTTPISEIMLHKPRLPKIDLPKFSGSIEEWPKFKELYLSIVHNDNSISKLEKFHYLVTSLSADAASLISTLTVCEVNYDKAWKVLLERYDNKRLLASIYISKILSYEPRDGIPSVETLLAFIRSVAENISAFKSLNFTDEADSIWLSLALKKLDLQSRQSFENMMVNSDNPTYEDLIKFVQDRCKVLQLTANSEPPKKVKQSSGKSYLLSSINQATLKNNDMGPTENSIKCCCNLNHLLISCPAFREMSVPKRWMFVQEHQLCFNCFRNDHRSIDCPSTKRCFVREGKHHSLLHRNSVYKVSDVSRSSTEHKPEHNNPLVGNITGSKQVLLGTAEVYVSDSNGQLVSVRLVYDCGSQFSLITAACCKRLGLTWYPSKQFLVGAGQTTLPRVKGQTKCQLISRINTDRKVDIEPLVLKSITSPLPTKTLQPHQFSKLKFGRLADPNFWDPRPIDVLLGSDAFVQTLDTTSPPTVVEGIGALHTIFGNVILGNIDSEKPVEESNCLSIVQHPISNEIFSKFWAIEEVPQRVKLTEDEQRCEDHFCTTFRRTSSGRYVVSLPFKGPKVTLGDSKQLAASRFYKLEAKLCKEPNLQAQYASFMREYLETGHMSLATAPSKYVMPHHAVVKANSIEKKIRVVFDASMSTAEGSLNDKLLVGPKLQKNVSDIVLNFRIHKIAFVGDIVKMYRQILIDPDDRCFQHILWRDARQLPLQTYQLNTVTYGTAAAPFLALRTIKQLTIDEGHCYPRAARVLSEDTYVDDLITGGETIEEVMELKNQLELMLNKGGFPTHKWICSSNILETCATLSTNTSWSPDHEEDNVVKVLGISWDPKLDNLFYQVGSISQAVTKRSILSTIARLFDRQGLLGPVIFYAKTIMQSVCMEKIDWDKCPPPNIVHRWKVFTAQLPSISKLVIPRLILPGDPKRVQIIGFSDASIKGYSAVLYLRVVDMNGQVKVSLIRSKSKLTPLKAVPIPRLELMGAHLLSLLVDSTNSLQAKRKIHDKILFCDSNIVLRWLNLPPHKLKTFVSNRISAILDLTSPDMWHHVSSDQNPADFSCRGLKPAELAECDMWWNGPQWLGIEPLTWPNIESLKIEELPEIKGGQLALLTRPLESKFIELIKKYSTYRTLIRTLAYMLRFLLNCKAPKELRQVSYLTPQELDNAFATCVRHVQSHHFHSEFCYTTNEPISNRFQTFSVFKDERGILRVGGRLARLELPYDQKHPIVLPHQSHFTNLTIMHHHLQNFHLGPKALQALLQRHFWIQRIKPLIRKEIYKCATCYRMTCKPVNPKMSHLPISRASQGRPFVCVGIDYAGPLPIKLSNRRNSAIEKAYLCLFVCMASKAVHLELVSSMSTDGFISALHRFVARRGRPSEIYSDCGKNFIGASRKLKELFVMLKPSKLQEAVNSLCSSYGIRWYFNPPYTPHFGGLWEAAVKTAKYHLIRTIGDQALTFEELTTLLARIEAVMNSRPLCPVSSDPEEFNLLTPGHFLIGAPLNAVPEAPISNQSVSHLRRWQLIQLSVQHFWRRWSKEYLHILQARTKWKTEVANFSKGTLVLEYDPSSLPLNWKRARIEEIHPDENQTVRVVTLRDPNGKIYKRAVHNLVPVVSD